jgi:hypothetical protein
MAGSDKDIISVIDDFNYKSESDGVVLTGLTPHVLPGVLRTVAEIAGLYAAIELCEFARGRRFYFPKGYIAQTDQLSQAVGLKAAKLLGKELGGETFEIPSARPVLRALRARVLRTANYSTGQIALILEMSRSQVQRLAPAAEYPPGTVERRLLLSVLRNAPPRYAKIKPAGHNARHLEGGVQS